MDLFTKKAPEKDTQALDELFEQVGTYRKTRDFKELLKFIKKFQSLAPFNAFLLHIQKPGSQYVATAKQWKQEFSRAIKPEARPLVILWPFGPVRFVYELGDTEGDKPFPKEFLDPFKPTGKLSTRQMDMLLSNLRTDGISYHESDDGTASAGRIGTANRETFQKFEDKTLKVLYNLIVNKNHNRETKFATMAHELAHLYCGHLGTPDHRWWPNRKKRDRNLMEFEAESVCWLTCERLGIHNPSAEYLSRYCRPDGEIPKIELELVLKSANRIESMMKRKQKPKKGLIVR